MQLEIQHQHAAGEHYTLLRGTTPTFKLSTRKGIIIYRWSITSWDNIVLIHVLHSPISILFVKELGF